MGGKVGGKAACCRTTVACVHARWQAPIGKMLAVIIASLLAGGARWLDAARERRVARGSGLLAARLLNSLPLSQPQQRSQLLRVPAHWGMKLMHPGGCQNSRPGRSAWCHSHRYRKAMCAPPSNRHPASQVAGSPQVGSVRRRSCTRFGEILPAIWANASLGSLYSKVIAFIASPSRKNFA